MGSGRSGGQGHLDDAALVLGERLAAGTLCRLLADEGHVLFADDYFADLFKATRRGRPTIAARVIATVMLLQPHEGLSDREAIDRLAFDLRWSAAAGLAVAPETFHPTVLVGVRNRLRGSARPHRRRSRATRAVAARASCSPSTAACATTRTREPLGPERRLRTAAEGRFAR